MPKKTRLSIPFELHKIKAQQIYQRRKAEGKDGNPEKDWEIARRYFYRHPNIVRVWKAKQVISKILQPGKRLWKSFKSLTNFIWEIIIFPFWLSFKLKTLFANPDTRLFALDIVKTIISLASLIAVIITAFGLFINYQDAIYNRKLTEERLITDRFAKAVTQIGDDKEEVVIGGIYSLERIAKDSPKDQWTIMEVLTAFVRKNSSIPPEIREIFDLEERSKALH